MELTRLFAFLIPLFALSIPIIALITAHLREMAKIKAQQGSHLSEEVRDEMREMKAHLAELRETTTKFDLSFDAALTRLEERVERVEQRQGASARANEPARVAAGHGGGAA